MIFNATPESLAKIINENLEGEIRRAIKDDLMRRSEEIINEVADRIAKSATHFVESYSKIGTDQLLISIKIDGMKRGTEEAITALTATAVKRQVQQ